MVTDGFRFGVSSAGRTAICSIVSLSLAPLQPADDDRQWDSDETKATFFVAQSYHRNLKSDWCVNVTTNSAAAEDD